MRPTVNSMGFRFWLRGGGKLHRDGGPAVEWPNGGKAWYWHGKLHRDDGPAIEFPNGHRHWYREGKLVRGEAT